MRAKRVKNPLIQSSRRRDMKNLCILRRYHETFKNLLEFVDLCVTLKNKKQMSSLLVVEEG